MTTWKSQTLADQEVGMGRIDNILIMKKEKNTEYEPPTKDELIQGLLILFKLNSIGMQSTISQIKKVVQDKRVNWKDND